MKIIEEYNWQGTETWQNCVVQKTDITRVRRIFAFFPILLKGKFAWLRFVYVVKRLHLVSYEKFEEWNYQHYWTKPKKEWYKEEILDDNDKRARKARETRDRMVKILRAKSV